MASYAWTEKMATKPFNPILNETYEYTTPTYKFFSEQVSHHPPVSAYHCEGKKGYSVEGDSTTKSKLSGKTLLFQMTGVIKYKFPKFREEYWSTKPTLIINNLIIGQIYIDIGAKMKVVSKFNDSYADIEFFKRGWSASTYYKCEATIYDAQKQPKFKIEGNWCKEFHLIDLTTNETTLLWQKKPYHEKVDFMYGFTHLAI